MQLLETIAPAALEETFLEGSMNPVDLSSPEIDERKKPLLCEVKMLNMKDLITAHFGKEIPALSMSHCEKVPVIYTPKGVLAANACSSAYGLIPMGEILEVFESALSEVFEYKAVYRHHNYCKFFVDYIIQDPIKMAVEVGDILPRIRMQHSYSGEIKFGLSVEFWRLICKNGLSVPTDKKEWMIHVKHTTGNMTQAIKELIPSIQHVVDLAPKLAKPFEQLALQKVPNVAKRLVEVSEATKYPARLLDAAQLRAGMELRSGVEQTDWLIYNALNYQINHNANVKMQEQVRRELDYKVLSYLLN